MNTNNYDEEKLKLIKEDVIMRLRNIFDPEIPVNIYDLGLIYDISFEEKDNYLYANIVMTLTSPGCPVADSLLSEVKLVTQSSDYVDEANVYLTFEPQWDMTKMTEEGRDILIMNGVAL